MYFHETKQKELNNVTCIYLFLLLISPYILYIFQWHFSSEVIGWFWSDSTSRILHWKMKTDKPKFTGIHKIHVYANNEFVYSYSLYGLTQMYSPI